MSIGTALNRVSAGEERGPWVLATTTWSDFRSHSALFYASKSHLGRKVVRSHRQGNSLNRWEEASSLGQGVSKQGWGPGGSGASSCGGETGGGRLSLAFGEAKWGPCLAKTSPSSEPKGAGCSGFFLSGPHHPCLA